MEKIDGQWYIFYHRQTNRSSYARQACAEKLVRRADGTFCQAEVTSCGLNGGPLEGIGRYEARIACNLWSVQGTGRYDCARPGRAFALHPYFTQSGKDREQEGDQYIANFRSGSVAGFKYFMMGGGASTMAVEVRGKAQGEMRVSDQPDFSRTLAKIPIKTTGNGKNTETFQGKFSSGIGKKALYFRYEGCGSLDFIAFEMKK